MLETLAAFEGIRKMEVANDAAAKIKPHKPTQSGTPRGVFSSWPSVQIHIHEKSKTLGIMRILAGKA